MTVLELPNELPNFVRIISEKDITAYCWAHECEIGLADTINPQWFGKIKVDGKIAAMVYVDAIRRK